MEQMWNRQRQWTAYVLLTALALAMTAVLLPASEPDFERFIGPRNPLLVVLGAGAIGAAALHYLQQRHGFAIVRGRATLRGIAISAGLATLMAVDAIIADLIVRFPAEMNVPMPRALLFYPAIGFIAEIVFHVAPLALLLLILTPLGPRIGENRVVWLAILIVAMTEPTFQVTFEGRVLTWRDLYTWLHVGAIALLQLAVFRRYDFLSMYAFRLIYYAYWHIAWGMVRLELLF
jgi:hypothetical protein